MPSSFNCNVKRRVNRPSVSLYSVCLVKWNHSEKCLNTWIRLEKGETRYLCLLLMQMTKVRHVMWKTMCLIPRRIDNWVICYSLDKSELLLPELRLIWESWSIEWRFAQKEWKDCVQTGHVVDDWCLKIGIITQLAKCLYEAICWRTKNIPLRSKHVAGLSDKI